MVFYAVAAGGEADAVGLLLGGFVSGNDAEVGGFAAGGKVCVFDEVDGVGACESSRGEALGEASHFVGGALYPKLGVRTEAEGVVFER